LIAILLFLGFKILEANWSYTISKPHAWEEDENNNSIPGSLKKMERRFRDKVRFYTLWFQIRRLKREKLEGAFAEVGVYRGETARVIHAMDNSRNFYLFDTFEGFSETDLSNETLSHENQQLDFSNTSVEIVREYIQGNENLIFLPGYFPDTAKDLTEEFALVNLDADLYIPTLAGLKYFYPRLVPGGVIIVHDYNHTWSGVKKALDEFMPGIPENLIEIADWQGSAMIIKNKIGEEFNG
jgi:O-methyltransferase